MSLTGKVAVITGGGSGIGRATCLQIANDGAAVAVWDWNEPGAKETVDMITKAGGRAIAVKVDVSSAEQVAAAAQRTRKDLGPITILVNNAAINYLISFLDITEAQWDEMMKVNLKGPYICVRTVIQDMLDAKWGRIVNITSSSTQLGASRMAHYVASKGGLSGFTKALASEFARSGITVNNVPPNFIETPLLRKTTTPESHKAAAEKSMMGHPGQPEDIAAAVSYLCSVAAKHINGHTLGVNGGNYMC
ncbi:MAG: SDR family oxidoreductase [Rhodospirillaceae bacterium]|nr:MAG: SDR family oxidoreductase [Rhodospirillaceae bacterium]